MKRRLTLFAALWLLLGWTPSLQAAGMPAPSPLAPIASDYLLPAYVNLGTATLLVQATGAFQGSQGEIRVTFRPRESGPAPCDELRTLLKPGGGCRLAVDISTWPDGDYRTEIACLRDGRQLAEPLVRWLRKQTIAAPSPRQEPINVRGLTTLFVDDEYVHSQKGLRRSIHPATPFAVTTGRMGPDRPEQKPAGGIRLEADGSWVVRFTDKEREDRGEATTRHYTARSRDTRIWKISEDQGNHPKPAAGNLKTLQFSKLDSADPAGPRFRYYDPATDGPVDLQHLRLRHTGVARQVRWGDLDMPFRTVFPVWEKSPSEHLVLTRQWLLRDKHDHPDGAPCEWQDTNDNFMNDFLSPDGRTYFYGQSRMILRHDPFRVPFDAFKDFPGGHYNRILVVWRSQDGLHWTPTYFDPQREDDPFSYQGYGAQQFFAEGKRLSLCYFFAYRAQLQQVCVELRFSRDNIHWQRLPGAVDDNIFAANGPWGSWNFGYMFGLSGPPVEKDGERFQLFASCQNVPHHFFRSLLGYNSKTISDPKWLREHFAGNQLSSYPFWKDMGGWDGFARQAPHACRTVGGMRYRKDGWVALKPEIREGELVTKVLSAGESLAINGRTRPGGQIRVEVLDAESHPLPGFSGPDAASFAGDSVNARLAWKNRTQTKLPGQPLRFRIILSQADLFALHWH